MLERWIPHLLSRVFFKNVSLVGMMMMCLHPAISQQRIRVVMAFNLRRVLREKTKGDECKAGLAIALLRHILCFDELTHPRLIGDDSLLTP